MQNECPKCKLWNQAAVENGHASGMCEDCFNQQCVAVNLEYKPEKKYG